MLFVCTIPDEPSLTGSLYLTLEKTGPDRWEVVKFQPTNGTSKLLKVMTLFLTHHCERIEDDVSHF
jgi:hypothetical protein